MLLATFAICGVFPFAGFWSKDEILWTNFRLAACCSGQSGAFTALFDSILYAADDYEDITRVRPGRKRRLTRMSQARQ